MVLSGPCFGLLLQFFASFTATQEKTVCLTVLLVLSLQALMLSM